MYKGGQFASMYRHRLDCLKPQFLSILNKENVVNIYDLTKNDIVCVVGIFVRSYTKRTSAVKMYKTMGESQLSDVVSLDSFVDNVKDAYWLEDESGRVRILDPVDPEFPDDSILRFVVPGSVVAVVGDFDGAAITISQVIRSPLASPSKTIKLPFSLPQKEESNVTFVILNSVRKRALFDIFLSWIDLSTPTNNIHVLICGGSIQKSDMVFKGGKVRAPTKSDPLRKSIEDFDMSIYQLCSMERVQSVSIVSGEGDPVPQILPQAPIPRAFLPESCKTFGPTKLCLYGNPCSFSFLGTTTTTIPSQSETTLRQFGVDRPIVTIAEIRNTCPFSPSIIATCPLAEDPFVITRPGVYVLPGDDVDFVVDGAGSYFIELPNFDAHGTFLIHSPEKGFEKVTLSYQL